MRYFSLILGMVFLTGFSAFSQIKYTNHTVSKGETVSQIAAHYNIKSSAIYQLNPDAKNGIKFKSVLLIPTTVANSADTASETANNYPKRKHTILPKETLYGIAKQYGVAIEDLYNANPTLQKSGLKKGYQIRIPGTEVNQSSALTATESIKEIRKNTSPEIKKEQKEEAKVVENSKETKQTLFEGVVREIVAHETKYSIAKEYGITVADLNKANPILETEALKIGQKITIPVKEENKVQLTVAEKGIEKEAENVVQSQPADKKIEGESKTKREILPEENSVVNRVVPKVETPIIEKDLASTVIEETEVVREVFSKETKYGIAKEYGISVKELERQNPKIVKSLPIGFKLNIRSKKAVETTVSKEISGLIDDMGNSNKKNNVKPFESADFLDQLVAAASENIGTRYRMGGTTKDGFDCSGLMCTTFGAFDIELPRTSIEQSQYGVKIDNEDAQKGDLIFFKTNGRRQINHVGMVVEAIDGDIKFIHASVSGGVMISSIRERYYKKKVSQVNRVL